METRRTIAKNAIVMMGSQVTTWALTFLLTVFVPRYLGAAAVGKFHFANSVWAIAAILVAFGTDTLLTKETAREPSRVSDLAGNAIVLRALLFVLGFLGVVGFLHLFGYPPETRRVVYVIGLSNLIWQLIGVSQATLQGLERMEYNSLGNVVGKAINTALSIGLLLLGQGVLVIAAVNVVAAIANAAVQYVFLSRLASLRLQIRWQTVAHLLRAGLPYLMSGVFLVIYMQFDIVIISLLIDDRSVGWYGAADQLFGTFLFVPTILMAAVFPALSRMYATASDSLHKVTRKSFDLLMVFSVPVGLGVLVIADQLVVLLFGPDFAPSGPILALMGIVLILTYLNVLIGQFLISMDRQNQWTIVMAIATAATLPLDLLLIPWCHRAFANGGVGGAISFVITESGMLVAGLMLLPRAVLGKENGWLAVRALAAGLAMVAGTWWLRDRFIAVPILVGTAIYGVLGWLVRLVPGEDVELVRELAHSAWQRIRPVTRVRPEVGSDDG